MLGTGLLIGVLILSNACKSEEIKSPPDPVRSATSEFPARASSSPSVIFDAPKGWKPITDAPFDYQLTKGAITCIIDCIEASSDVDLEQFLQAVFSDLNALPGSFQSDSEPAADKVNGRPALHASGQVNLTGMAMQVDYTVFRVGRQIWMIQLTAPCEEIQNLEAERKAIIKHISSPE